MYQASVLNVIPCLFSVASVFKCQVCMKAFVKKSYLKEHEMGHVVNSEMFQCPKDNCDRRYALMRNLNAHIKSYHLGQNFPCSKDECNKTFATKVYRSLDTQLYTCIIVLLRLSGYDCTAVWNRHL